MQPEDDEGIWATTALRTSFKRALESLAREFTNQAMGIEMPKPKKALSRRKTVRGNAQRRSSGEDAR